MAERNKEAVESRTHTQSLVKYSLMIYSISSSKTQIDNQTLPGLVPAARLTTSQTPFSGKSSLFTEEIFGFTGNGGGLLRCGWLGEIEWNLLNDRASGEFIWNATVALSARIMDLSSTCPILQSSIP